MKKKHIIIGASAAGMGVLSKLRKLAPDDEILCVAAQTEMPFNTCLLANFLSTGIAPTGLYTKPESFFTRNNINLKLGTWVSRIDKKNNRIQDTNGNWYPYDNLFVGIGQLPRKLTSDFTPKTGLFYFNSLHDVLAIEQFLQTHRPLTAIVVGAGLSGVECADALTERGVRVTILDPGEYPLTTLLDAPAGEILENKMNEAGTTFYGNTRVTTVLIEPFSGKAAGVLLKDDIELYADMVIVAIGTKSNFELASQIGSSMIHDGIMVNSQMLTDFNTNIYCGGDAAAVPTTHRLERANKYIKFKYARSTTWPDAMQQGMVAAHAMAGQPIDYPGLISVMSSHFYGTQVVSSGNFNQYRTVQPITYMGDNWHHSFIVEDDILRAFLMIGNIRHVGLYRKLLGSQEQFDTSILDPLSSIEIVAE